MKIHRLNQIILISTIILISILYWNSLMDVPFHPDEATQIFMSKDIDLIVSGKGLDLIFSETPKSLTTQHYRLVDPPFTRYTIGFARLLLQEPGLKNDWNWSSSWNENLENGALPSHALLSIARNSIFLFFPFCLYLIFKIGAILGNNKTGWAALFLYATNSLVMLHTQRAMTEGPLMFWILLSVFFMISTPQRINLSIITSVLAINTKITAVGLLPVIFLLIIYYSSTIKKKIINLSIMSVLVIGITAVLNPIYWKDPIKVIGIAVQERSQLMDSQTAGLAIKNPEKILSSPLEKLAGLVGNIFLQPPAISDIANYDINSLTDKSKYLNNPIHTISQQPLYAIPFLITSISGFFLLCYQLIKKKSRMNLAIILLCSISQISIILIVANLPFQRYVLPIIPYSIFFSALFISSFLEAKKPAQN